MKVKDSQLSVICSLSFPAQEITVKRPAFVPWWALYFLAVNLMWQNTERH